MMTKRNLSQSIPALLCALAVVGAGWCEDQIPKSNGRVAVTTPDPAPDVAALGSRTIRYSEQDVITVKTKVRFTTLIVLPKTENILDFTCGDKEFWVVNGNQNFAYIKPAKTGERTNLNLVTASGNIYSFIVSEVSNEKAEPDLKLFVELRDEAMVAASRAAPRFVPARDLDAYRQQAEAAQEETKQMKIASEKAIHQGIQQFVSNVRFDYRFEAGKKPFNIRSMYHDDRFTYIQARPEEAPALYELKDGQPNLINFEYKDGVYVVQKILDRGYFVIGKQKLGFTREE